MVEHSCDRACLYRVGYVRDPNYRNVKGSRPPIQPMNEKRLSVELIAAYNREKDSDVVKRLMLVILVERDGMQRTKPRYPWTMPGLGA